MRIVIVTRELPPLTDSGGIGASYAALAPALAAQGHEVVALVPGLEEPAALDGVRALPARSVARELRRLRCDAVLAPDWQGDAAASFASRKPGTARVTHLHGPLAQVRAAMPDTRRLGDLRPRRILQARRERLQAERSDGIVAVSEFVLEAARADWRIGGIPARVIPNGIDLQRIRRLGAGEPPAVLPRSGRLLVFAGRLDGLKGVTVLVEAMREVWASVPDAHVAFFGPVGSWRGRPMDGHLRSLAGGNAQLLHVLGSRPHEELLPAVAAADALVAPSAWEAFGLVAAEAAALGTPAIATPTGLAEVVVDGESGLIVPHGRVDLLAAAILRMLNEPGLRDRLSAGAVRASAAFDLETVARRLTDFLAALD